MEIKKCQELFIVKKIDSWKDLIYNLNKDKKVKQLLDIGYAFHIRYDWQNDNHIKIYDPEAFGEKLVFVHKKWSLEKQNEVVNQLSI